MWPRVKPAGRKEDPSGKPALLVETHIAVLGPGPSIETAVAISVLARQLPGVGMDGGLGEALPNGALS